MRRFQKKDEIDDGSERVRPGEHRGVDGSAGQGLLPSDAFAGAGEAVPQGAGPAAEAPDAPTRAESAPASPSTPRPSETPVPSGDAATPALSKAQGEASGDAGLPPPPDAPTPEAIPGSAPGPAGLTSFDAAGGPAAEPGLGAARPVPGASASVSGTPSPNGGGGDSGGARDAAVEAGGAGDGWAAAWGRSAFGDGDWSDAAGVDDILSLFGGGGSAVSLTSETAIDVDQTTVVIQTTIIDIDIGDGATAAVDLGPLFEEAGAPSLTVDADPADGLVPDAFATLV